MMPTTNITIPDYPKRKGYQIAIGATLDGGSDVVFLDTAGNEINCSYLNVAADATYPSRPRKSLDADVANGYFVKGGWHQVTASKFFDTSHTASAAGIAKFD